MNKSNSYLTTIDATNPVSKDFLQIARKLLRGSKIKLRVSGRHPNRKRFYGDCFRLERIYRQNFPIRYATSYYINLTYSTEFAPNDYYDRMALAKKILANLIGIYKKNGSNIFIS